MMITASPTTDAVARYAFRRSILEPEKSYTLFPDRLEVEAGGRAPEVHDLATVRRVHLKYRRTRQRGYYECLVHTDGGRLFLRHVHWNGPLLFEDRRAAYTPFVGALVHALSRYPGVEMRAGSLQTFVVASVGAFLMCALGAFALAMRMWMPALLGWVGFLLCALTISRSFPRRFTPETPPANLLPT